MIIAFTDSFNKKPSVIVRITDGFEPSVITACYHRPTNIDGSETACDDGSEPSVMRLPVVVLPATPAKFSSRGLEKVKTPKKVV